MMQIEWEVINKDRQVLTFNSINKALMQFQKIIAQWKDVVPLITSFVDNGTIFILFQDGYVSLKFINHE